MNEDLKVSLIIPTYKDDEALKLILNALAYQTYSNFEVIVAEDSKEDSTQNLLKNYTLTLNNALTPPIEIKHYSHEDLGNRKPKAINSAIKMSSGEYLVFIDGDTLPFKNFIKYHVMLGKKGFVVCGRRVNLGTKISKQLRDNSLDVSHLERCYLRYLPAMINSKTRHIEQGFSFNPKRIIFKILSKFDKNINIVASNFSCFKDDILKVNGVDEALPYAPARDDTDLQWRLEAVGIKMKSGKFCANLFHLDHERDDRVAQYDKNLIIIKEKQRKGEFWAKDGVYKSSK